MSDTLPIHERFRTFQGEGVHMGRPAFFIRTFGCPVKCPWCDSAGTWHPNYVPDTIERLTADQLVSELLGDMPYPPIVVITGGEPAVHDLAPLCDTIHNATCMEIHLETSGGFHIKGDVDWITLSPKKWKLPLPINVYKADEYKVIVEGAGDIDFYLDFLRRNRYAGAPVYLHPEWSKREDRSVLQAITSAVKSADRSIDLRAGWQLHKLYRADSFDSRSKPTVPLGGNPALGY